MMRISSTRRSMFRGPVALRAMALVGLALTACSNDPSGPNGEAQVRVLLTDFPLEAIASAEVSISRIYLTGGDEGQVDLFHDEALPHEIDLLDLQDGVTFDLTGDATVPAGTYGQLRFVVDAAHITLAEGYTFADGSSEKDLDVPSGFFRVILQGEEDEEDDSGSLDFEGGETEIVLVDFDVSQSFVFLGPPDSPTGVHFKPVLRQLTTEEEAP